ncbi:MAG: hypothetical protein GY940_29660, partial [bacterium]|nr:hypothetical protein [bacterium]
GGDSATGNTADKDGNKQNESKSDNSPNSAQLTVNFKDGEVNNPGAFELKKTFELITGMHYNGRTTAKLTYIAFANYEAKLGFYSAEPPKEAGQILILISFKTDSLEVPFKEQNETYAKMRVPTGIYNPTWMGQGKSFQVTYYMGPNPGGPGLSGNGSSGTATLEVSTPERVKGSIDFTSEKGSTIKGTFDVKIEKDIW